MTHTSKNRWATEIRLCRLNEKCVSVCVFLCIYWVEKGYYISENLSGMCMWSKSREENHQETQLKNQ